MKLAPLICALIFGIASGTGVPAAGTALRSAIYCQDGQQASKVFAAKLLPNGDLSFGLSLWIGGRSLGVVGVARRTGRYWTYERDMTAPDIADRCRVVIDFPANGTPSLTVDPIAKCANAGGQGTELGSVRFSPRAYEGPVKDELSGHRDFDSVGKCWKKAVVSGH